MKKFLVFVVVVFAFLLVGSAKDGKQREFVGVKKCKTCHKKKKTGDQYGIWSKSSHAKAFATLAGNEAKKIAKEKGIADPQKSEKCLKCHVTAFGVDKKYLGKKYKMEDGVGCESCHGAGGDYYKKKTMKKVYKGEIDAASIGLVVPDEKVCKTCHNAESPTFKSFDFKKYAEKIAHKIPK